jgi:hypothetical protein
MIPSIFARNARLLRAGIEEMRGDILEFVVPVIKEPGKSPEKILRRRETMSSPRLQIADCKTLRELS